MLCCGTIGHNWPLVRHYFYYIESINDFNIFCYHNITLLLYHNILLSHYSIIILTYSVILILHYYFIILFYYHIIQLLLLLLQIWVNISHHSNNISNKNKLFFRRIMINNQVFLRKTHKYTTFVINMHYLIFRRLFAEKKTPEGTAPASKRGWSYPITFRSLVVGHTARTQHFPKVWQISKVF